MAFIIRANENCQIDDLREKPRASALPARRTHIQVYYNRILSAHCPITSRSVPIGLSHWRPIAPYAHRSLGTG